MTTVWVVSGDVGWNDGEGAVRVFATKSLAEEYIGSGAHAYAEELEVIDGMIDSDTPPKIE